jgi:uncharacterized protein YdbL (DUF1318 family)
MKKFSILSAVLLCLILVIACVTVNIYFPAGEVQKAADEIVDEVRPGQKEGESTSRFQTRPRWSTRLAPFFAPGLAFAQVDIDISTPAIRALRASLAGRFGSLKGFYSRGSLGENNKGYIELRDQSGLDLKGKADLRRLVKAENRDRKDLYMEIIKANNLEPRFLPEVEKIFANSWRKKALAGSWIQNDDGTWTRK